MEGKRKKAAFSKGVKACWVKASRVDVDVPGVFYRGWNNIYSVLSALQIKAHPCCDASLLHDTLKISLQSKTSLRGLEQAASQAELPVQAKEMPKVEISQSQLLIVQSNMGRVSVRALKFRESFWLKMQGRH